MSKEDFFFKSFHDGIDLMTWFRIFKKPDFLKNRHQATLKGTFLFLDEKKQYDPIGFRDAIIEGLDAAGNDLEAVAKFLDTSGSKLDYRRYGVNLIEILIAGGLLGKFAHVMEKILCSLEVIVNICWGSSFVGSDLIPTVVIYN